MSKELTPLQALKEIGKLKESGEYINTTVEYKIIETALKRIPELERELCFVKTMEDLTIEAIKDKKLKALEIIKRYANKEGVHINFLELMKATVEEYNRETMTYIVDEEKMKEYDLLKEVLL